MEQVVCKGSYTVDFLLLNSEGSSLQLLLQHCMYDDDWLMLEHQGGITI